MHPSYKMEYFTEQEWEATWKTAAEKLLMAHYDDHYKSDIAVASLTPSCTKVSPYVSFYVNLTPNRRL